MPRQVFCSPGRSAPAEYWGFSAVSGVGLTCPLQGACFPGTPTGSLKARDAPTTSREQVTVNAIRAESQVTQDLLSPADDPVQTLLERIEGCLRGCFPLPILNHLSFASQHRFTPSASKHHHYWMTQKKTFCVVTPGDRCYC